MSTAVILEPRDFDRLMTELKQTIREEIAKLKEEKRDRRLNMKQAASFLNMSPGTLSRKIKDGKFPVELIHVVDGSRYLLESELDEYQRKS